MWGSVGNSAARWGRGAGSLLAVALLIGCTDDILPPEVIGPPPDAPNADIQVVKTQSADSAAAGDRIVYTITVRNNGPVAATNVFAGDTLPTGLAFVSFLATTGTFQGGVWSVGPLGIGAEEMITVVAEVEQGVSDVTLTNRVAAISLSQNDSVLGNNVDSVMLSVSTPVPPPPPPPPGLTILFQDDFENGFGPNVNGYRWGTTQGGTNEKPVISTDIARSGNSSLKFIYRGSANLSDDAWSEQRFAFGAQHTEIYLQWYQYFPDGTEGLGSAKFVYRNATGPDNNKFLRLWDIDYSNYRVKLGFSFQWNNGPDPKLITEWGINQSGVDPTGVRQWTPGITDAFRGRWVQFRLHVRLATSANNDGVIELWADGTKVIENLSIPMYPSEGDGNFIRSGYLMGWANTGFDATTFVYIDDFTVSTGGFPSP